MNHILEIAFDDALKRATEGKGEERHGRGIPFISQPIMTELNQLGPIGHVYQIRKKALESIHMPPHRAALEMLDIIIYAAAVYLQLVDEKTRMAIGGEE